MINELNDMEFDDLTDERKLSLLNDKYQEICARYRWPFLETFAPVTIGNDGTITYPADFAHVKSAYLASDKYYSNLFEDDGNYFLTSGSQPSFAKWLYNKDIVLVYYMQPDDLTSDTEPIFPSRHHEAVVYGGAARAYLMTDDSQLGQLFMQLFEDRVSKMVADLLRRDVAPRKVYDTNDCG